MDMLRSFRTKDPFKQDIPLLNQNKRNPQAAVTNGETRHSLSQQDESSPRAQRLFRSLGISFAWHIWYERRHSGRSVPETKKTALQKDFWAAFFAGSVHFIPIAAAFVLVVLNWRGYYIGGELAGAVGQDDAKFLALQFAAKLHELTISASLTAVIFSYVRHELVTESGLPFGAVVAGLQFKDISYLWSMEFWGVIRASWRRRRDKWSMVILIVICVALAVSAGPSSAILMKPRQDNWPAGGTDFWIAMPQNEMLSTNVSSAQAPTSCMVDTGDLGCPSGGWQSIAQNYMSYYQSIQRASYLPDTVQLSGATAVRTLRAFHRSPNFQFSTSITTASVASSAVADALVQTGRFWAFAAYWWRKEFHERFWSRIDVTYTVEAAQPIVIARCWYVNNSNPLYAEFVRGHIGVYDLWNSDYFNANGDFEINWYNVTGDEQVRSLMQAAGNTTVPDIAWATFPQSNGSESALGAIVLLPLARNSSMMLSCTLDARMKPATVQSLRSTPLIVTGFPDGGNYDDDNTLPRISIEPAWAKYLNPTIPPDNSTSFQETMRSAGLWDSEYPIDMVDAQYIVESYLSLSVANGLARRDFGIGFSGTLLGDTDGLDLVSDHYFNYTDDALDCDDWCKEFLPSVGYAMGPGGNAFNITNVEKASSTKFTMHADANGWAYSARGSAAKFAIFALLLYSLIAASHWIYTCFIRESSSSWASISELVALAMKSDQSETFKNMGAGIDSAAIYKKPSKVIEKDGNLQLAVDGAMGKYELVKPNETYG